MRHKRKDFHFEFECKIFCFIAKYLYRQERNLYYIYVCWGNWPLLVALTYADERLFRPDVLSVLPSWCKTRDSETIVLNSSVILVSSLAEHSSTFTLKTASKIQFVIQHASFSGRNYFSSIYSPQFRQFAEHPFRHVLNLNFSMWWG